jgi:large subunit ribosomal protein L17
MRHQVKGRKLGRTTPHRKATLQALSVALITEKRIKTTLAKAKELRRYVEPVITKAKNDTTHSRRQVFASLQDKYAVTELFENIAPAVGDRPGGYTRVLKLGRRLGDAAEIAVIELVDFNDVKPEKKEAKKKRTRRAGKANKPVEAKTADEEVKEEAKKADTEEKADAKPAKKKVAKKADTPKKESPKKEKSPEAKSEVKADSKVKGSPEGDSAKDK